MTVIYRSDVTKKKTVRYSEINMYPLECLYIYILFLAFFWYFFVFVCKLYRRQTKRYYNASLNNFYIKKDAHKKKENEKEREVKKPIT